jgi:hypothetical protein
MTDFIHFLQTALSKDTFYWFCALAGSGMFIIQFLLTLFGIGHDQDMVDAPNHLGHFDAQNFKWLTKQTVTGFLMFFGWVGLTCKREFVLSNTASAACAVVGGLIAVFVTAFIFKMAKKLRSPGAVFRIEDAIGKEAIVYQRIPKNGLGKISISLHHHTHEIDAMAMNREEISSFTQVQIVKNMDDKIVVVVPIK